MSLLKSKLGLIIAVNEIIKKASYKHQLINKKSLAIILTEQEKIHYTYAPLIQFLWS